MKFPTNNEDLNSISQFKADIVSAVSQIEEKMTNRLNQVHNTLSSRISVFQTKISDIENELKEITSRMQTILISTSNITTIAPTQKKFEETLVTFEIRLNSLSKELSNSIYRYDKIILDNLMIPGQVGEYCKHKNLKEYITALNDHLLTITSFKDKITYDLKHYKEKNDKNIYQLTSKIDASVSACHALVNSKLVYLEKDYSSKIEEHINKISDVKLENLKHFAHMKENAEALRVEVDTMRNLKSEIIAMNEQALNTVKNENTILVDKFNSLKNEFSKVNRHFTDLVEFIKDVRFKKNINTEVSKNDLKHLINNLENNSTKSTLPSIQMQTSQVNMSLNSSILTETITEKNMHKTKRKGHKKTVSYKDKGNLTRSVSSSSQMSSISKTHSRNGSLGNVSRNGRSVFLKRKLLPSLEHKLKKSDSHTFGVKDFNVKEKIVTFNGDFDKHKKRKIPTYSKLKKKHKIKTKSTINMKLQKRDNNDTNTETSNSSTNNNNKGIFCKVTIMNK